ncbi:MAG: Glu-tRNA(Gln) amidotransferase subunit GatE [Acidobacteriota bacterium]
MYKRIDGKKNTGNSKKKIGFIDIKDATPEVYENLGFKCGLEVHQQLLTDKKLFCRCPAGKYQKGDDFEAEIVRHMRPTLSELGEYDGTALMEFRTRKNITYRLKNENACTYEIDDTPPFPLNRQALNIAIEIALLLKTSIVGELHITRKQYLDGSIPTGFQRTAIVGIEGDIPLRKKNIRIIQLSIEEDSCREISDIGHERVYSTDRLGIPLIETVTYPDMKTPAEAAEAGHYIRFLTRSTGKVRTGIGAAREDVNVSITGGTRVEIKGVSRIKWIPSLTHVEAFRQKALLEIKSLLEKTVKNNKGWNIDTTPVEISTLKNSRLIIKNGYKAIGIRLPGFRNILSFFTQPGKTFGDELSDRVKVIACIEKPNLIHDEDPSSGIPDNIFSDIYNNTGGNEEDAFLIISGPAGDIPTAEETIRERCLLAFDGVPNETRKAVNRDGITIFERVLPGPDRMYPDTDSAPIAIKDKDINKLREELPSDVSEREKIMKGWNIPEDTFPYIHIRNIFPVIKKIYEELEYSPAFIGTLIGHRIKNIDGKLKLSPGFNYFKLLDIFAFCKERELDNEIIKLMVPVLLEHPNIDPESILLTIGFKKRGKDEIISNIPLLEKQFSTISNKEDNEARKRWVMGQLRPVAVGNIPLKELSEIINGGGNG